MRGGGRGNKSDLCCSFMWGCEGGCDAEGGERLMTHRLTTVPLRDQYSNTVEMIFFFLSPEKELESRKGWGHTVYTRAAYCMCLSWYEYTNRIANPHLVCIYATHTHTLDKDAKVTPLCLSGFTKVASVSVCRMTHHGELCLQFFDPVLLHIHLSAQDVGLLRGFFGLPPQVPLLPLQHVLLLCQGLHCVLTLLMNTHTRTFSNDQWSSKTESSRIIELQCPYG